MEAERVLLRTARSEFEEQARRLITERCLIATDIDKTILIQGLGYDDEREQFLINIAPQLLQAASYGTNLALLTGNSMDELSSRLLKGLIDHLCHTNRLTLLKNFHFFCNSGGIYAHFPDPEKLIEGGSARDLDLRTKVFEAMTVSNDGKLAIRPSFIDVDYIGRSMISSEDAARIKGVLEEAAQLYLSNLNRNEAAYRELYDLRKVSKGETFVGPSVDVRPVQYGSDESLKQASVQVTLKPILSFYHAHNVRTLVGRDLRADLINTIQSQLDERGLREYVARAGGS